MKFKTTSCKLAVVGAVTLALLGCDNKLTKKDVKKGSGSAAPGTADQGPGTEDPNTGDSTGSAGLFKDCAASPSSKFVAKLYQLPEETSKLPDFSGLSSIREICLDQLDISQRSFEEGFPGAGNLIEWFALDISFMVKIEQEGDYYFRLNSDDGAIMYIGDTKVIDNDGLHAPSSKDVTVNLKPGDHRFRVQYFQGPRYDIALQLFWITPGNFDEAYLPLEIVSRP